MMKKKRFRTLVERAIMPDTKTKHRILASDAETQQRIMPV